VIIDESLASDEGEQAATDQAGSDQAGSDQAGSDQATADGQATADDWAAADAATEEATVGGPTTNPPAARDNLIVIVDDTAYDDTALEAGPGTEAVTASDDVMIADYVAAPGEAGVSAETRPAADVAMATGSGVARDARDTGVTETEAALADAGVSAETPDAAGTSDEAAALDQPAPPHADALPVPSYDSLSLPSLRARLRNLDIDQVRMLAEYERGHAARADVITMFERRIDKLAAGQ
jgi:hypothetical protein